MNAMSISHWGLISFPDNEKRQNIVLLQDGTIERFDDSAPCFAILGYIKPTPSPKLFNLLRVSVNEDGVLAMLPTLDRILNDAASPPAHSPPDRTAG